MTSCRPNCFDFGACPGIEELRLCVLILSRFGGFSFGEALSLTWEEAEAWSLAALDFEKRTGGGR
jgi:hypothetical protein